MIGFPNQLITKLSQLICIFYEYENHHKVHKDVNPTGC